MNIRWSRRAERVSEGGVVHERWETSTLSAGSFTPSPHPTPFYRRLFLTREGVG